MPHASRASERPATAGGVLDDLRADRADQVAPSTDNRRVHGFTLSVRMLLVLVVLAPMAAAAGFASTTAVAKWSTSHEALAAHNATLQLDSLMRARAAIVNEYVPTAAITYAAADHVTPAALDSLLGIDFVAELVTARRIVDQQTILRTTPSLSGDYRTLLTLRRAETSGGVSFEKVQGFFDNFGSAIDTRWLSEFDSLSKGAAASASLHMRSSLAALSTAFTAFNTGLEQATLAQAALTSLSSNAQVQGLIVANEQFASAIQAFPGQLGPQGTVAWETFEHNPLVRSFNSAILLAIRVGLDKAPPPFATNLKSHAGVFKALVERVTLLTGLVLAASADLRTLAASQQNTAANGFIGDLLLIVLVFIVALGGVLAFGRAVGRPLDRFVKAASAVRAGEFDLPGLDESGPKELALAAGAFNEMSSTLRALEAHAVALAGGDLQDPVLDSPLPGRTGRALQAAIDHLHESIRANETQRELLHERATHDSLTGILNRGAAVDALERDLARARRGDQTLALLFIDLDGLKTINDTLGHEAGDAAITAVGNALRTTTRQSDVVARIGGDEFVVGWLGVAAEGGSWTLAERIRRQVCSTVIEVEGQRIPVDCSIGIALSEPTDLALDSLMNRADQALYLAKADGGGRIRTLAGTPELAPALVGSAAGRRPGDGAARPARLDEELAPGGRR